MNNSKKMNKFSMNSRSLKQKLRMSFCLMSILPLLVCMYLVSSYILPTMGLRTDIAGSIAVSIFIAVAGFFVLKEIFDRIVSVSSEAKLIANGEFDRKIAVKHEDEVGDLSDSLNQLTQRIRVNMDELKTYGEKTTEINLNIQKRVIVLSSLLQISSLISQGAKLDDILKLIVEKSRLLASSEIAYLLFREEGQDAFLVKVADGMNVGYLLKATVDPAEEIFNKAISLNKPMILDKSNVASESATIAFNEKFKLKHTLAMPVYLRGRVMAILGIGNNRETFAYMQDDLELLDIFAKQVAIAAENDVLIHKVEKLEVKDTLTGLYNEAFIRSRLQDEIKRSIVYQRPCAYVIFDIDNFSGFHKKFGSMQAEGILKRVAVLIRDSVTEIDRVARTGDDEFSVLLPEKNKRQAQEIAEDIRKRIESGFSEESDPSKKITVSGGIGENPLDGVGAEELISKAKELLNLAKRQGRNRVTGFKDAAICQ